MPVSVLPASVRLVMVPPWKFVPSETEPPVKPRFGIASSGRNKLPPVNWIRSRTIDTKHIALDLRFNWEKQQAMGTDAITVAPFNDTDRFTLDAAQMTINSVTTADGKPLKFNYKGGSANDNLEIILDHTIKSGEDVKVDLAAGTVSAKSGTFSFPALPGEVQAILDAGGLVQYTRKKIGIL